MPKTNYKVCLWLIEAVSGKYGTGGYMNGQGYSLKNLNELRPLRERIDFESPTEKTKFRQDVMRWRAIIYNQFGLVILGASSSGNHRGKNEGGYYYYLHNEELLDKEGMTLRKLIEHLAECETDLHSRVSLEKMSEKYRPATYSFGFMSAGGTSPYGYLSSVGTSYRRIIGEEKLELIQFAMQFGEVLSIMYGKWGAGTWPSTPYSFEPYQLKEIEGRWYVIGNLYPHGHRELAKIAVYDLVRLRFAHEESPDLHYEPVKGFDILDKIQIDACCRLRLGKVITIKIWAIGGLARHLSKYPLCSSQDEVSRVKFLIRVRLTADLIVQLGAYGIELTFDVIPDENTSMDDVAVIKHLLNQLRETEL